MGGLEHFFARTVHDGLALIYYIIETHGKSFDTKLMEDALKVSVKRHPLLRGRVVKE